MGNVQFYRISIVKLFESKYYVLRYLRTFVVPTADFYDQIILRKVTMLSLLLQFDLKNRTRSQPNFSAAKKMKSPKK